MNRHFREEVIEVGPFLAASVIPIVTREPILVYFLLRVLIKHFNEVVGLKVVVRVFYAPFAKCSLLVL